MVCGTAVSVLLFLLWSLVEVHSQTAPYVTFMEKTLSNNSYVDLSLVGGVNSGNEVLCHTDLSTCCHVGIGPDRGDWYFPNGDRLPFPGNHTLVEIRQFQRVELHRGYRSGSIQSGIYRCSIETTAVNSDDNTDTTTRETVYVGLYDSGGDITIPGGMTLTVDSDLNGANPQFTLTCISTGGPATTVTWTRNSEVVNGTTVLDDTETAQYIHALTVTGRLGGLYQCTVENAKPSLVSASLFIQVASAPSNLMVVQESPTSVRVSWSPPIPLGDTTGYRISYSGGSSGSVGVSGGSTDNYLLTGLQNGVSYTISIAGISQHIASEVVEAEIKLVPGQPSVNVDSTTATTISLSGSVPSGSVVDSYEVMWSSEECPDDVDEGSATISDGSTSYTIESLREGSSYTIIVTVTNSAGTGPSNSVTAETEEDTPTDAPTSVSVSEVTFSSITVQWGAVDCIHRNGDITGYSVRYGVEGSGSTQIESVSGSGATQTIISGLEHSTTYTIDVAAVNSAGTGVYSTPITILIPTDLQCSVNSSAILVAIFCESIPLTTTTCSFDGRPAHQCELPLVITLNVSPAGLHSVLITASNASYSALNTVQYSLLDLSGDVSSVATRVPPLEVDLINDSPRVVGGSRGSVEAEFTVSRPVAGVRCILRSKYAREVKQCFSGNVTFSDLRPGLYVLKIHAYNRQDDSRTVKRGFVVTSDPDYCSLVLVNEGVRVSENGREAVVKVKGHGPAEGFSCVLDSGEQFSCSPPAVQLSGLSEGRHKLKMTPVGCASGSKTLSLTFTT